MAPSGDRYQLVDYRCVRSGGHQRDEHFDSKQVATGKYVSPLAGHHADSTTQ